MLERSVEFISYTSLSPFHVTFLAMDSIGGVWNYTEGESNSSVYKNTHINTKVCLRLHVINLIRHLTLIECEEYGGDGGLNGEKENHLSPGPKLCPKMYP